MIKRINNKKTKMTLLQSFSLGMLILSPAPHALAIESLSEDELGYVTAQDGITLDLSSGVTGLSINTLELVQDSAVPTDAATITASGITLQGFDALGNVNGAPAHASLTLDVTGGVTPTLEAVYTLDRARLKISDLTANTASAPVRSFGTTILDASGSIVLRNAGIFNDSYTTAYLKGQLDDAALFYQPLWSGHPYLTLNKLNALWEIPSGKLSVTSEGIKMSTIGTGSPLINVKLDFDILYKFPAHFPGEEFRVTANDRPLMHFGWIGSLKNAELIWRAGGSWSNYDTTIKTGGISLSSKWDFVSYADANSAPINDATKEFRWQLGEAAAGGADRSRVNFELSDWATWSPTVNANGHSFPLIAIDAINSASTTWKGQLCWGGSLNAASCAAGSQPVDLAVGNIAGFDAAVNRTSDVAIALLARKGNLMSFSRKIKILETDAAGVTATTGNYNWGLIYTLANVDANFYLYPGGSEGDVAGGSRNRGVMADIMLMSQSLGAACNNNATASCTQAFNWDKGSHFMIADTDIDDDSITGENRDAMGIGLVSNSFLFLLNDTRIWLKQMKDSASQVGVADDPYLSGVDVLSRQARINVKGTFGGGVLPPDSSGLETIRGGFININLEGLVNFRMSSSSATATGGKNFLGYSAAFRLMDTNIANFSESTLVATNHTDNVLDDDGTFFSMSEPSNASADLRFANITGDMALTDGRIDMRGSSEAGGGGKPQLKISNTILIGSAAANRMNDAVIGTTLPTAAAAGQVLDIGRVEFGNMSLGRIVIPSAQMYTSITLKPQ